MVFLINVEFVHKFHVAPHASYFPSKMNSKNIRPKSNTPKLPKFCYNTALQNAHLDFRQIAQFLSSAANSHRPPSSALLLRFATLYINYKLPLRKDMRTQPGTRQNRKLFVEQKRNVMAHAQKPDLVFHRNGRVHLYRRGCQFSRLLAAEWCASAIVMLDRPCPIQCTTAGYPLHSPFSPSLLHPCVSVCHHIPFLLYSYYAS